MSESLKGRDFAGIAGIALVFFIVFLVLGNFGNIFKPLSPETVRISQLFQFIYIAGLAVGSIFLSALIFLSVKFREREAGGK